MEIEDNASAVRAAKSERVRQVAINRQKVQDAAQKHWSKRNWEKSLREYKKLVADDPKDERSLQRIGDLYAKMKRPEEALAEALQVQVQRIFHRLFDVRGCQFAFREGLRGEPSERVRYNITRLLLETARHRDEQRMAG